MAAAHDLQDALEERFFRAYLVEGQAIGEPGVISTLAMEVGLPRQEVTDVLQSDRFASEVRQEETMATALGIRGVPYFVFANRYAVSGAQHESVLRSAADRALAEGCGGGIEPGSVCGPKGCG